MNHADLPPDFLTATYTIDERSLLAGVGARSCDLPLVDAVKMTFPEAVVIGARNERSTPRKAGTG